jgi:Holliday junction resolvase RusA-like endonuclease
VPALSLGFVNLIFILLTQGEREALRASAPKKFVVGKADLVNLVKFVLDAMGGVAFADDQQISQLTCEKVWDVGDGSTTCTLTEVEE